jgi:hypothetical protein
MLAKENGLGALSITDHDTCAAYAIAKPLAASLGILLGHGIEFSSFFGDQSVHILGYDYDVESREILSLCHRHTTRRSERNARILERLRRFNMVVHEKELPEGKTVGRPHIAGLLVQKGYVSSVQEAFDRYIGDGKPCFDPGEGVASEETIAILHAGGGKAFLAHPHIIKHTGRLKEILSLPFDGIECYYARSAPHIEKRFLKLAAERGLLVSGGSDFHGAIKPNLSLGSSWVDEVRFHQIFQRL